MTGLFKPTRRSVLLGAGAMALPRFGLAQSGFEVLEPKVGMAQILPEPYPQTEIWGFNGISPGPQIRVKQGQRVQRRLVNSLAEPAAVHWHGIRNDNAMDGVPGLTQEAVAPGATFDYDFIAPDAGTYWYHTHYNTTEQMDRGLYGALIVDEADALDIDREEVLIIDDWLLRQTGEIDPEFQTPMNRSHAGRMGNFVTTNSLFQPVLPAKTNERMRLRLINASNARIFPLGLQGLAGWIVAYDGMPVATPERVGDFFLLAPAQRVDLIVDVTAKPGELAAIMWATEQEPQIQVGFDVTGAASRTARPAPRALPANDETGIIDLGSAVQARLVLAGGAMGTLQEAELDGEVKTFRQLAQANQFWALNGVVGMTDKPLVDVGLGETVRMKIENESSFPHAMHLHGQHFRAILPDGSFGPMRDTLYIGGLENADIAFVASNPGKWLYHCHMLSHQDAGMKTWMNVRA